MELQIARISRTPNPDANLLVLIKKRHFPLIVRGRHSNANPVPVRWPLKGKGVVVVVVIVEVVVNNNKTEVRQVLQERRSRAIRVDCGDIQGVLYG